MKPENRVIKFFDILGIKRVNKRKKRNEQGESGFYNQLTCKYNK